MNDPTVAIPQGRTFTPLQYHLDVCRHLEQREPGLWNWFASDLFNEKHVERQKLELLKSTFRLGRQSSGHLYELAERASQSLEITLPITLYQAQSSADTLNAALMFLPQEISIVLHGDLASRLNDDELTAVFAHEIAHHKLYTVDEGKYFTAMRLLSWCCAQPDCPESFYESDRRYQLFTEVYADLGALQVIGDWQTSVSSLIKVTTGLRDFSVQDYVAQADEVLEKIDTGSEGVSHPETYLRAKFLHMVEHEESWSHKIDRMISGKLDVTSLDFLDQVSLSELSGDLIDLIMAQTCMRTDSLDNMAQQYFPDYDRAERSGDVEKVKAAIENCKDSTREYLGYLLLDFASADPDVSQAALSVTLLLAEQVGLDQVFETLVRKELKHKKQDVEQMKMDAQRIVEAANEAHASEL
ncbi:MAG: M48 family metalloprotease [Oceanospirillales bacterium]|nr:M48 family metalloprotease [Oceanospirillales bacterium]